MNLIFSEVFENVLCLNKWDKFNFLVFLIKLSVFKFFLKNNEIWYLYRDIIIELELDFLYFCIWYVIVRYIKCKCMKDLSFIKLEIFYNVFYWI